MRVKREGWGRPLTKGDFYRAMLAYIFWHRPFPQVAGAEYEPTLLEFHQYLARAFSPGCWGSAVYRTGPAPWLGGQGGYEDWYFVDAAWALDPLNRAAVSGEVEPRHSAIAALMETAHGGLYSLLWGDQVPAPRSAVAWLTRPRGIRYETVLEEVRQRLPGPLTFWRRQMLLGPAPEFALIGPPSLEPVLPSGWQAVVVERTCLWPAPDRALVLGSPGERKPGGNVTD